MDDLSGEYIDNTLGLWTAVPHHKVHGYHLRDVALADPGTTILTLRPDTENWALAADLPKLKELILHQPTPDQLAQLANFQNIKRLRIAHCRLKSLDNLRGLASVEQLLLMYVSGVSDLSPLADMPSLLALNIDNMRGVQDLSELANCQGLKYLGVTGTEGAPYRLSDTSFLLSLAQLESFVLGSVRYIGDLPALSELKELPNLRHIRIPTSLFPIETYAQLRKDLPGVLGAAFEPFQTYTDKKVKREISLEELYTLFNADDRRKWDRCYEQTGRFGPIKMRRGWNVTSDENGRFYIDDRSAIYGCCIGKGARTMKASSPAFAKAKAKAEAVFQRICG